VNFVDEILSSDKMKSTLSSLTSEEVDDLREWMNRHLAPIEMLRLKMRETLATEDGVDKITEAVEYIFSKEGSEKWQEKN